MIRPLPRYSNHSSHSNNINNSPRVETNFDHLKNETSKDNCAFLSNEEYTAKLTSAKYISSLNERYLVKKAVTDISNITHIFVKNDKLLSIFKDGEDINDEKFLSLILKALYGLENYHKIKMTPYEGFKSKQEIQELAKQIATTFTGDEVMQSKQNRTNTCFETNEYICSACYQPGHFIYDCPNRQNKKGLTPYQGSKECCGEFMCSKCKRIWYSLRSGINDQQKCKKCNISIYPKKQYDLKDLLRKTIILIEIGFYEAITSEKKFKVFEHIFNSCLVPQDCYRLYDAEAVLTKMYKRSESNLFLFQ